MLKVEGAQGARISAGGSSKAQRRIARNPLGYMARRQSQVDDVKRRIYRQEKIQIQII
jgi:hypothetical protein